MKLTLWTIFTGILLIIYACNSNLSQLNVVDSKSFSKEQISLAGQTGNYTESDLSLSSAELSNNEEKDFLVLMDELQTQFEAIRKLPSDESWLKLKSTWNDLNSRFDNFDTKTHTDSSANQIIQKWAEINIELLKFSEEVKFGDVLEKLLAQKEVTSGRENLIKSILYTHVDDQIYINLLLSSTLIHQHTTGGTVKLIMDSSLPAGNQIILKCETDDVRYLDVFFRIPEWAVNPTVSHGNVKYVAHPGEYCQISRKWKSGDEFIIELRN